MPAVRATLLRAPSVLFSALMRVADALLVLVVLGVGVFAALLLLVRFVVFPNIDRYRDDIVAAVAAQVHEPVTVAGLTTGWDGWSPKLVIESLRVGRADQPALLELPRVDLTVAWTSVLVLDLRLKQLVIEGPRLAVRRGRDGVIHVAGIELDPASAADDTTVSDWLLRQREIVVRNGLVAWTDELREAPQLVLDDVHFRIEHSFGRHRFGLTGRPPAELAAPIDIRGEVRHASARDWQRSDARFYVRLDYADVGAWREWLGLPIRIDSGKGAVRAWFAVADGEVREITADVELGDVRTRLAPALPELALAHVVGRVGWRYGDNAREMFARQLSFATASGERLSPTNVAIVLEADAQGRPLRGRFEYDRLDLAPLREVAAELPLPAAWREDLTRFSPHGTLLRGYAHWDGAIDAPSDYDVAAEFADVGIVASTPWPGATGLSGSLKANAKGGAAKLASRDATLRLPRLYPEPLMLQTAEGNVTWTLGAAEPTIKVEGLTFANRDAAGKLQGTYRVLRQGPGEIDLEAALTRASVEAVPRYVPSFVHAGVREWLQRALKPGAVDEVKLKLKGNLAAFPFSDATRGLFTVDVKARGMGLDYAEGWPAFSDIDGDVHFRGAGMSIEASRARLYGVTLGRTTVVVADLRDLVLQIEGEASGPTRDFLRFVAESPVQEWTERALARAEAAGDGRLALKLTLPLHDLDKNKVSGEYRLIGNQVKLPDVPALAQVNGRVAFTERDVAASDVTAQALGGPVKVAFTQADGRLHIAASGNSSLQAVRREVDVPLGERVTGNADWSLALDRTPEGTRWTLDSPLTGVAVDLPVPLHKTAVQSLPLRIERPMVPANAREDAITARVGDVAHIAVRRVLRDDAMRADAVLVSLGRATARADARRATRPGLWLRAELPELDVDQWLAVRSAAAKASGPAGATSLALAGVDLDVASLTAFDREFKALKVRGQAAQDDWKLELEGNDIAGSATWSAPRTSAPNGRVVARLARFSPPPGKPGGDASPDAPSDSSASAWPELDVAADVLVLHERELGQMQLLAKPQSGEWRIERLSVANDAGRFDASGAWRAGRRQETRLDIALDVKDSGAFLTRLGKEGAVQGAPTKIAGDLAWTGAPSDFDYATLSGSFRIEAGAGRFVKVHPGIGKLLGVLSLQALPRRISLDFRDVFSEGFTFDRVTGSVKIARGIMSTDDLRLTGPSAQVAIAGEADLEQETQRLRVRVQPTLSAGVSAGAALLFFANPIVGAAVGAGSLLAQKVLRDPVEQMFSYQYTVTGSWSDPQVTRGATMAASGSPETRTK